jgi:hypothetical protein
MKTDLDYAFDDGYQAGFEFHLGDGIRRENPYNAWAEEAEYAAWEAGFSQAGDDS